MQLVGLILWYILWAYLAILMVRAVLSFVPLFIRDWRPRGIVLVIASLSLLAFVILAWEKASGLAAVCTELGVESAQVAAFGDMPNDLPMLAWAGQGFAIAQGHHLLLRAGFARTEGPQDEAVGRTILRLLG